jgi:orotidine-5'-phosphate decarboxylase
MLQRPRKPHQHIIVALDVPNEDELSELVVSLSGQVGMFKIGKELFTSLGPRAVSLVRERGGEVFLDLKYHDIPNTVAGAVRAAARLGVSMLTVHASGGTKMIQAAAEASAQSDSRPAIIAVTLLTSLGQSDVDDLGYSGSPQDAVMRLAALSLSAGAHGLVNSPREVKPLRKKHGDQPLLITPGVRPAGSAADDQTRIATPAQAVKDGADFLVIGRPITKDPDPAAAAGRIAKELAENA